MAQIDDGGKKKNCRSMTSVPCDDFRENHCVLDASETPVNLEADNGSRGCRMPHERALSFKHRSCRAMKLLKTRGNWMKAIVEIGEKGKSVEGRKKRGTKTVSAAKRISSDRLPFYPRFPPRFLLYEVLQNRPSTLNFQEQ